MQVKMSFAAVLESLRGSKSLFSVQDPLGVRRRSLLLFFQKAWLAVALVPWIARAQSGCDDPFASCPNVYVDCTGLGGAACGPWSNGAFLLGCFYGQGSVMPTMGVCAYCPPPNDDFGCPYITATFMAYCFGRPLVETFNACCGFQPCP